MTMGMTQLDDKAAHCSRCICSDWNKYQHWHKSASTWEQEVEKVDTCVLCACAVTAASAAYLKE